MYYRTYDIKEKFEDSKGIKNRKLKDEHYNGQDKKKTKTNNGPKRTTQKY